MEKRIKAFSSLKELSDDKKIKYSKFEALNNLLEREGIEDYNKIYDSYFKIITGEKNTDFSDYSELDFQIKYLIEEEKVAVNSILEFAGEKFPTLEKALLDLFDKSSIFSPIHKIGSMMGVLNNALKFKSIITKKILEAKKGDLVLKFINPKNSANRSYLIRFDLQDLSEFKKFEKEILDFDVDKIMNENNMIIQGIGIKKY